MSRDIDAVIAALSTAHPVLKVDQGGCAVCGGTHATARHGRRGV